MPDNRLGKIPITDFKRDQRVRYIPQYVREEMIYLFSHSMHPEEWDDGPEVLIEWDDVSHPKIEEGIVSSVNGEYVFVKYIPALQERGWEDTLSGATYPRDLIIVEDSSGIAPDGTCMR